MKKKMHAALMATLVIFGTISPGIGVTHASNREEATQERGAEETQKQSRSNVDEQEEEFVSPLNKAQKSSSGDPSSQVDPAHEPHAAHQRITPNEQTGAMEYTYPFKTIAGVNGHDPQLSLSYSSQNKSNNNIAGFGWSLSIPEIRRLPKTGVHEMHDAYIFESNISGELVPINIDENGFGTYGAKKETGNFLIYTFHPTDYWTIHDKLGNTQTFGLTESDRQDDPTDTSRIFKWMISETQNAHGASIIYTYEKESGQIYPTSIAYIDDPIADAKIAQVSFGYGDRADIVKQYETGFAVETKKVLQNVTMSFNGEDTWIYELEYVPGENGIRSLLNSITLTTYTDNIVHEPTIFTYSKNNGTGWAKKDLSYANVPKVAELFNSWSQNIGYGTKYADINGDGYADAMLSYEYYTDDSPPWETVKTTYINNTDGTGWNTDGSPLAPWHYSKQYSEYYVHPSSKYYDRYILDINGDGIPEQIDHNNIYSISEDTGVYEQQTIAYEQLNGYVTDDLNVIGSKKWHDYRFVDVNGDGLTDAIKSYYYYNNYATPTQETWTQKIALKTNTDYGWEQASFTSMPFKLGGQSTINPTDPNVITDFAVRFADVNGDGLSDAVLSGVASEVPPSVYLNMGEGYGWVHEPSYSSGIDFAFAFVAWEYNSGWNTNEYGARFSDVNGDGFDDVILAYHVQSNNANFPAVKEKKVFINNADGTGWTHDPTYTDIPFYINKTDPYPQKIQLNTGIALVDVNGDGFDDAVAGGVYLSNATQPDMLVGIELPSKASIDIGYTRTTQLKKDGALANPKMFQPTFVVTEVTRHDGLGNETAKKYFYEGGEQYYNTPLDRQFAGFKKVSITNAAGKTETKYFHQGNDADTTLFEKSDGPSIIGLMYRSDITNADGALFMRTTYTWESTDLPVDPAVDPNLGQTRTFIRVGEKAHQTYDGDESHRDAAVAYVYDEENGNLLSTIAYGEVAAEADGSFSDVGLDMRTEIIEYAEPTQTNDAAYRVGFPKEEKITDIAGGTLSRTTYMYDNLNFGFVEIGNQTTLRVYSDDNTFHDTNRTFDSHGNITSHTDPNDNTTEFIFDEYGLYPVMQKNALNHATTFAYDYATGNPTAIIDANGYESNIAYDGLGRLVEEWGPDNETGASVLKSTHEYDDLSTPRRILRKTYQNAVDDGIEQITYVDGFDRPVQTRVETEGENLYIIADTIYDQVTGNINAHTLPYVQAGSAYTNITPNNNFYTTYDYDVLGRPISVTNAVGTTVNSYQDWIHLVIDANGNKKEYGYDSFGRLAEVKEYNGDAVYVTTYEYTPVGAPTRITDALGNTRDFTHDWRGLLIFQNEMHAPGLSEAPAYWYTYDGNGNMLSTINPNGQSIVYTYDTLNRVVTKNIADAEYLTHTYDVCENGIGRLCVSASETDLNTTTYSYTPNGQIKNQTRVIDGSSYLTEHTYDYRGHEVQRIHPNGLAVKYTHGTAGLVNGIEERNAIETLFTPVIEDIKYNPANLVLETHYANGVTVQNTYDENQMYRLAGVNTTHGSSVLQKTNYTYDAIGNILQIVDDSDAFSIPQNTKYADLNGDWQINVVDVQCSIHVNLWKLSGFEGDAPACLGGQEYLAADLDCSGDVDVTDVQLMTHISLDNLNPVLDDDNDGIHNGCEPLDPTEPEFQNGTLAKIMTYKYDDLYRLTAATYTSPEEIEVRTYAYNPIGNITYKSDIGAYTYDQFLPHRLIEADNVEYAYDENGNITQKSTGEVYTFDAENQLTHIDFPSGDTVNFLYDYAGQRIAKYTAGVTTIYPTAVYEEKNDKSRTRLVGPGGALASVESGVLTYHVRDHLGSTSVNTNEEGAVVYAIDYYPYGETRQEFSKGTTDTYTYTGKEIDAISGLHYYGARYYDATIARFIGSDALSLALGIGGQTMQHVLMDPQLLNLYAYTKNNPVIHVDPDGNVPAAAATIGIPALLGMTAELTGLFISDRITGQTSSGAAYTGAAAGGAAKGALTLPVAGAMIATGPVGMLGAGIALDGIGNAISRSVEIGIDADLSFAKDGQSIMDSASSAAASGIISGSLNKIIPDVKMPGTERVRQTFKGLTTKTVNGSISTISKHTVIDALEAGISNQIANLPLRILKTYAINGLLKQTPSPKTSSPASGPVKHIEQSPFFQSGSGTYGETSDLSTPMYSL